MSEYHTATPYLIIKGASDAIEFYKQAFDAKELMRIPMPDGKLAYAEIKIGDSIIMLTDEYLDRNILSPKALGGSPVGIYLYVADVDALAEQAVAAGAKITRPLNDEFFGDRLGGLEDPFGHIWYIATKKEKLSRAEMLDRLNEMTKQS